MPDDPPRSGNGSAPWHDGPDTSLTILVVDDESDLRDLLTRSFSREGHRVEAVADGRTAIELASTEQFDVVLLDVALGPWPGRLRGDARYEKTMNLP